MKISNLQKQKLPKYIEKLKLKKLALDMRALEPSFKFHFLRGIGRYVRELEPELLKSISNDFEVQPIYFDTSKAGNFLNQAVAKIPIAKSTLQTHFIQPLHLGKKDFDYMHFFAQGDPPVWGLKKPYSLTVHDLIPLKFPQLYRSNAFCPRYKLARSLEISSIKNAKGLITISESSKKDLVNMLGVDQNKIHVTHLAVSEKFFSAKENSKAKNQELRASLNIPEGAKVLSYIGGIDPRKNVNFLISLLDNLVKNHKEFLLSSPPYLMMIGAQKIEKEYLELKKLIISKNLDKYVLETGFIDDKDLLSYYKLSDLFIFPSLYEGFGLPVLEAMAAEIPAVAGNNSAMPELSAGTVEGERGAYLLPDSDIKVWSERVADLLNSPEKLKAAGSAGRLRAREFSWRKAGKLTGEAFREFFV